MASSVCGRAQPVLAGPSVLGSSLPFPAEGLCSNHTGLIISGNYCDLVRLRGWDHPWRCGITGILFGRYGSQDRDIAAAGGVPLETERQGRNTRCSLLPTPRPPPSASCWLSALESTGVWERQPAGVCPGHREQSPGPAFLSHPCVHCLWLPQTLA